MGLFSKPETTGQAYLKMGIYGNAGSGKTYTATQVAIGLSHYVKEKIGARLPAFFLDTETGSDWVKPKFDESGVELLVAKTRSFSDLKDAVTEAEKVGGILLVDSITHFWEELKITFAKERKRRDNKLEFQDFATLKPLWGGFTDRYINGNAHIILCGRAGNTYEYQENEEKGGKKELISTGTKMKAETEMGYEPSLLVEMVAEKLPDRKKKLTIRKGYVIKDRSTLLDGREFINPTFKVFQPHIDRLNIGGEHKGFDASRNSSALFDSTGRSDYHQNKLQREIVLEEIQNLLVLHKPGQSAEEKKSKVLLIRTHFNAVWTELEQVLSLQQLRQGYNKLHIELEGVPSKYFPEPEALNDEIPEFGGDTVPELEAIPAPSTLPATAA